ncbi:MAG: hypothetical protein L3J62_01680 [Gammaproteobacteria bacterium]|nr:hypothetical protein [Gammaproteobacteria bacterium]MCF6229497.1 hypothetical protein [Gammaproteobacteria bacterium]
MEISKEVLALWGAGLSTALALVKMWELWSSRSRIEVSYGFSSGPDGNDIIIRNLSDKPMTLTYWELLFCERKSLKWIPYRNENPAENTRDIFISAHSSKTLNFSGQDYFEWGQALTGKRLYLNLHIAGKRSAIKHLVYKG